MKRWRLRVLVVVALGAVALGWAATGSSVPVIFQSAPGRFEVAALDGGDAQRVAALAAQAWPMLAGPLALPESFASPVFVRLVPAADWGERSPFRVTVEAGGVVSVRVAWDPTTPEVVVRRALVQGLLPQLLASGAPRVVMVASESHRAPATLDFDNFPTREKGYFAMRSYGQAKLCNVLMANELQRRYGAQGLMSCSLHPGTMVTTNIGSESALVRFAMKLVSPFTKDCNQGAATSVWAAVHEPAAELGAQYLRDCRIDRATPEGRDAQVAGKLWDLSERWLAEHAAR